MEISKKERLLQLISEEVATGVWLKELHYLFSLIKEPKKMARKVIKLIASLRDNSFDKESLCHLKAQLEVFKKYELESVEFN